MLGYKSSADSTYYVFTTMGQCKGLAAGYEPIYKQETPFCCNQIVHIVQTGAPPDKNGSIPAHNRCAIRWRYRMKNGSIPGCFVLISGNYAGKIVFIELIMPAIILRFACFTG